MATILAGGKEVQGESRDRFLQHGEAEAFFAAMEGEPEIFRDFFLTLLLTGRGRKRNTMQWADLDLTAGFWRIPENKNGSVMVVPLVAPAVAILASTARTCNGRTNGYFRAAAAAIT